MSSPLTLTGATFDSTGPKFGSSALSGGFGAMGYNGIQAFFIYGVTFECWTKGSAAPTAQKIAIGSSGFAGLGCDAQGHVQFFYVTSGGSTVFVGTSASIWDGLWHHIVGQAGVNGGAVYVDGVLAGSGAAPYFAATASNPVAVRDMGGATGGAYTWPGEIDEAATFACARYFGASFTSPVAPYTGNESGLFSVYHFDGDGSDGLGTAPALVPPIVAGLTAGGNSTIEGQFFKGLPANLTYSLDGAAAVSAPSVTINGQGGSGATQFGVYSFVIATPSAGAHAISVSSSGAFPSTTSAVNFTTVSGAAATLSAPAVSGLVAGGTSTISSSFYNGAPTGLSYSLDGAAAISVASPSISVTAGSAATASGTCNFTMPTPAVGAHTLVLIGTGTYAATSSSSSFTTTTSQDVMSAPTISGLSAAGVLNFVGTFSAGAPTGIDYSFDGAAASAAVSPVIAVTSGSGATAAGTYGFSVQSPGAGAHTLVVSGTGAFGSASPVMSFVLVAPNDPGLVYSPYNWSVGAGAAQTVNSGAYLKTLFNGASVQLLFDVSAQPTIANMIACKTDDGGWSRVPIAPSVNLSGSGDMSAPAHHFLQMVVSGSTDPAFSSAVANRWAASSPNTATILTGMVLTAGSSLGTPVAKSGNLVIFGDSITEGLHTLFPNVSSVDVQSHAAEYGWAYLIGDLLDCEVGVVGFGGQGLGIGGDGAVPAFPSTYNFLFSGVGRVLSPTPNLVVINEGTNDAVHSVAAAATSAGLQAALNGLLAMSGAPIAVLQPFSAVYAAQETANIQAAISACSNPSRVSFVQTQSPAQWMLPADMADAWHPNAVANLSRIAPLCAAALRGLAWPTASGAAGPVVVLVS